MSGYHKSIEVYKFLRKNGVPVIVPIRNLYVSGTHMDVMYIDHNVTIVDYTSTQLELYDYTEQTVEVPTDHQFNIIGIGIADTTTFTNYTTETVDVPVDHQFNIIGININNETTFTEYGNETVDVPIDHQFNVIGVALETYMSAVSIPTVEKKVTDHMLTIADFTSTALEIS